MGLAQRAKPEIVSMRPQLALQDIVAAARAAAVVASSRAAAIDTDGAFPADDLADLRRDGLLAAALPPELGGADLGEGSAGARALMDVLRALGAGNLSLGRIYEGHVNAVMLVRRYGTRFRLEALAGALHDGATMGVWAAEIPGRKLRLEGEPGLRRLVGKKILASGAGHLTLPLVPAVDADGRSFMVLLPRLSGERADVSGWTVHGMRASATGTIDLTGLPVDETDIIGRDCDYLRQPFFSGGAWRFCAVQLGAMDALLDAFRQALTSRDRSGDPLQRMRIAECTMAVETARLWVERAALMTAGEGDADRIVAYVDLTRLAVERAALDLMDRLQRGIGLQAFVHPNPVERIARDLRTYLRQPAPDAAMLGAAATILAREESIVDFWDRPA